MKTNCTKCGGEFTAGVDGILDPVACDVCMRIERDNTEDHAFWLPEEKGQWRLDLETGTEFYITREQAFGRPTPTPADASPAETLEIIRKRASLAINPASVAFERERMLALRAIYELANDELQKINGERR